MKQQTLDDGIRHALSGTALLFAGAGFVVGSRNVQGKEPKLSRSLSQTLAEAAGLPPDAPLDDAAEAYAETMGEDSLITLLQDEYTISQPGDHHIALAQIPWRRIYTTNYDDLLETAHSAAGRRITPITTSANIYDVSRGTPLSIHLNGYIHSLDRSTLWRELKLTETSYLTAALSESSWAVLLREDIRLAKAVFVIGYSAHDIDIKRILFDSPALRAKTFFVLGPDIDETIRRRVSRFGEVLTLGVEELALECEKAAREFIPLEDVEHIGQFVDEYTPPRRVHNITDQEVFGLFLDGTINPGAIWTSLHEGPKYYLERPELTQLMELINKGSPAVVLYSDLGNGKTATVEGLKPRLVEEGYRVYYVKSSGDRLDEELGELERQQEKAVLIVEEYPEYLESIKKFRLRAPAVQIVTTARSSAHDVLFDQLCEAIGVDDLPEISFDRLGAQELNWLVEIFDEYGLWGPRAAWSLTKKRKHLERECGGEFHGVLLWVLESPQIASRFANLMASLNHKKDFYQAVVTILVMNVLRLGHELDMVVDLGGASLIGDTRFRRDATIRSLINFERGVLKLRSSVAAEFILKHVADAGITVEALTRIARAADAAARISTKYWVILKTLMRYSSLQFALPEMNRRRSIIRYYEAIKNLHGCRSNPLFWLQYAIACVVVEEFDRADKYFATAYSFAEARNYDTFQIDNHFARFILVRAIHHGDKSIAMTALRKARKIVFEQMQQERLHYPYRVASHFRNIYDTFATQFSADERDEIGRAASFILRRIESLPDPRRRNRYVKQCEDDMLHIIVSEGSDLDDAVNIPPPQ